jgi:hypothetical protein
MRTCLACDAATVASTDPADLASSRLAKVHWQAGDRPLPAPRVSVAGESALWVDPAEIPSYDDIGKLGQALALAWVVATSYLVGVSTRRVGLMLAGTDPAAPPDQG